MGRREERDDEDLYSCWGYYLEPLGQYLWWIAYIYKGRQLLLYSRVGVVVLVEPVSGSSGSASSTGLRGPGVE